MLDRIPSSPHIEQKASNGTHGNLPIFSTWNGQGGNGCASVRPYEQLHQEQSRAIVNAGANRGRLWYIKIVDVDRGS
ncbi:hypothetical protein PABG_12419 [Paracoccidioides brasiliensis Pb03]|nr:hypothetical protein PABG_12419 [Paracoccidioides brasiliensis Pb03]